MGKKKGKQHDDRADEGVASAGASLADFFLSETPATVPDEIVPTAADPTPADAGSVTMASLPSRAPPEQTLEELEARHKKEKRELEGAARAAKKAAGKNKAKVEEADAAAEEAMEQLRQVHESEVRGFNLRDKAGVDTPCEADEAGTSRRDVAGIKEILTAQRPREPSAEELRIDPSDSQGYPLASFIEVYGEEDGRRRWAAALPSGPSNQRAGARENAPYYTVFGSKKGGFPVTVESRARGKKVTVIHNVSGDVDALLSDIKGAVGAGGLVREGDVEVQGDHSSRIEAMLLKLGCIKGVSHTNVAAALPAAKPAKAEKSIARLDKKAAQPSH